MAGDRRVSDVVLERARDARLLGATVHRAAAGFGHGAHLHRRGFLDHNYPVIVEIVDEEDRLRSFWSGMASLAGVGLVTLERVEALRGGRDPAPSPGAGDDAPGVPS
jgi:PII-like signaling protein